MPIPLAIYAGSQQVLRAYLGSQLIFSGYTPPAGLYATGILREWRFDDGSGQILTDYGPNQRHGQLGTTVGGDAADPAWTAAGLDFDGTDDHVVLPVTGMPSGNHDFTLQAVVVMPATDLKGTADVFSFGGGGTRGMFSLAYNTSTNEARVLTEGDDLNYVLPVPPTWPNLVFMITGRYRASDLLLSVVFQALAQEGTKTLGGALNLAASPAFRFGSRIGGNDPHKGGIVWAAVYDIYLPDTAIQENYEYARALLAPRSVILPVSLEALAYGGETVAYGGQNVEY